MTGTAAVDGTVFRRVIGSFTSGVVVITTEHDGVPWGMTVSAVSSLSLEPPMLLVCLNAGSRTQEAVRAAGRFAVNILAEGQGELADRFARSASAGRFDGVAVRPGRSGLPLLTGSLAVVECRVVEVVGGGTHRVFLAEAVHAEASDSSPLAYFRGAFGRFELAQDAHVYRTLRQSVLRREHGLERPLDLEELAGRLGAPAPSVYQALTRLAAEGLVDRDPERGYVVAPLDTATADDVHDAKLALELGAADIVVGQLGDEQLAEFRRLARAAAEALETYDDAVRDAYVTANHAFHRYLVEATGIRALVDAYEQLSLPTLMAKTLAGSSGVGPHLTIEHEHLVDALERADLPATKEVIRSHTARAKQTVREALVSAGGLL